MYVDAMTTESPLDVAMTTFQAMVDGVRDAPTAETRAQAAADAYEYARTTLLPEVASMRRSAIRELRAMGYSLREAAELLGVSDGRISQITGA